MPVSFTPDNLPRYESGLLSYLDTNFQRLKNSLRSVAVETVGSVPADPYPGQRYVDTTAGKDYVWNGTVWVVTSHWGAPDTYTPVITQSAAVTNTVQVADYVKEGRLVTGFIDLNITGSGTASNMITVTSPITDMIDTNVSVGTGYWYDADLAQYFHFLAYVASASTFAFFSTDIVPTGQLGASGSNATALANNDKWRFSFRCLGAS